MSAIAISSPFSTARTAYTLPSLQGRGRTLRSLQISHHTKLHTRLSSTLTGTYITRSRFGNNNKNTITNAYAEENNGINYSVEKSADDFSSKEVESNSVLNSSEGKEVVVENKEKNNAAAESPVEGKSSGAKDNLAGIFAVSWSKMAELFKLNGFWKWWPFWQREKRLQYLAAQADANPADSAKQSAFLSELNKHSPEDVIKRFEQKEYATDSQAVAEYLRALVVTNTLSEYLPDEHSGRPSFLPALLQELKERASGSADSFLNPGLSERHPLHVVMVDPKAPTKSARFAQELISTILFVAAFGIIWFIGTSALRKYTNSLGGVGSPPNISTSSSYSPKEYSKEFVPDKNNVTFKNVKGCDEAKQELQEVVEYLKNPAKFTRLGGKLPKGILLTGSPGTGKTLLAKAVAGEAGVPFFYRAGSEFEEMFVGVGARRVRSLFQAAKKKAPCIVFIDEIDAIGSTRKQWEGHTKKTLHQLLVEMDGFEENEGILLIAATNLPEILDPALTRPGRFDKHVVVPNPDVRGRQEILDLYLQNKPVSEDVDVKTIARSTAGFNGADLANLVNIAAIQAAMDGDEKLTAKQLEFAKDRIIMGTERKSMVLTEESRKLTAYHEGGHAIVAYYTNGANPLHKATIMPRGAALGMVTQLPDKDETSMSKKQMLASIDVCMGGRVAEELIFGDDCITTGAHSDFQKATEIAEYMVSKCGMSAMLGPFHVREKAGQTVQTKVDAEVMKLLRDAYDRVRTLLKKREEALHALAQALLEKETLNAKEIENILGSNIITIDEAFQSEQQADQVELAVS